MLPISLGYNDTGSAELQNIMAGAIHNGLLGIPPTSVSAAESCPSGECTWQAYDTLAVCSLCEAVTATQEPGGIAPCHKAPTRSVLGPNICIFPSQNTAPTTTRFFNALIYYIELIISIEDRYGVTKIKRQASKPYHCSLSWCIRSFSSATATGGVLVETPRKSSNLTYNKEGRVRIFSNSINSSSSSQPPAGGNYTPNFTVDESSNLNLINSVGFALTHLFPENNLFLADPTLVFNNIANAISAQLRTIPFSSSSSSNSLSNITTTTSTTVVAPGTAFYREPVLIVRWAWLAFPVFLLSATAFFLFLVIFTARNPVWKDSFWPLVLLPRPRQGAIRIDQGQGQGQSWGYRLGDMERRVRLQRGERGGWGFTFGRQERG